MDAEVQAQAAAEAQRLVDEFIRADEEYKATLAEVEEELPEAFEVLYAQLEARNAACTAARNSVRRSKTKCGPFTTRPRTKLVFDADAFIRMAKEQGIYEELVDGGVIRTDIDGAKLKSATDPQTLTRFKEGCGKVIETSINVYGPKELGNLK